MNFSARALVGLVLAGVICWILSNRFGLGISGVLLGVVAAQFTLLLARQPSRKQRIVTSILMIPGYWLGLILMYFASRHPLLQVFSLPLLIGLGFWSQQARPNLSVVIMAMAWICLFAVYFHVQQGPLLWHLAAIVISVSIMMAVRFVLWRDDRPTPRGLILRSHQLILIDAAKRAVNSNHIADVIGKAHRALEPVVRSLAHHPHFNANERSTLANQRLAVEIELLQSPEQGTDIARALQDNPFASEKQLSPQLDQLTKNWDSFPQEPTQSRQNIHSPATKSARRALQVSTAVALAAFVGYLISPERWPWAVIVAMFMFFGTESSGRLLSKGIQNVAGVVLGLLLGVLLSQLLSSLWWGELAALLVMLFLAFYLIPVIYALGMAAVTALIALAFSLGGNDVSALLVIRLEEVLVGASFGVAAGLLLMPERGSSGIRQASANFLAGVANALDPDAEGPSAHTLRNDLGEVYKSAEFGPIESLFVDGSRMRAALIELARIQHLVAFQQEWSKQSPSRIDPDRFRQLAEQCRTVAAYVLDQRQASPDPIVWPADTSPQGRILAAIGASLAAILSLG